MATTPISVQKYLKGIDYPATKEDLLSHAKKQGADKNVMDLLGQIADEEYDGPTAVSKAVGEQE